MAAVAAAGRRSLLGKLTVAAAARRARHGRPPSIVAALAVKAREHVVTFAALTSVDFGVFRASGVAGFIVTGVSLLVLDFAVRG